MQDREAARCLCSFLLHTSVNELLLQGRLYLRSKTTESEHYYSTCIILQVETGSNIVQKCPFFFYFAKAALLVPIKNPQILLAFVWKMRGLYSPPYCPDAPIPVNGKLELPQATSLLEGSNDYSKCATLFACI